MIKVESFGIVPFSQVKGEWQVLLILHQEGSHWGFPKGKANPGESPLEAATRELKEETGLEILEVISKEPLVEQYQFRRKKEVILKTVHYYSAKVTGELEIQQAEIREAKWLSIPEAMQQLSFREARNILHEFAQHITN